MADQPRRDRVGFIGSGKMATALASGLCRSGFTAVERVIASDVAVAARQHFAHVTQARVVGTNSEVVSQSDILFLAVKPQQMTAVLHEIHPLLSSDHLIVSIAAGVSLETLVQSLGTHRRLVRVMPNTPCLVGASASAFAMGGISDARDAETVEKMLASVGLAVPLSEQHLDAVTGLSGSGPAFVYVMIEALSDAGVKVGLTRDVALKLAAQTVLGAAKMVLETGEHPGALKDAVTSPGGTTITGLHVLEQAGLRGILMNAVEAATQRSAELGRRSAAAKPN